MRDFLTVDCFVFDWQMSHVYKPVVNLQSAQEHQVFLKNQLQTMTYDFENMYLKNANDLRVASRDEVHSLAAVIRKIPCWNGPYPFARELIQNLTDFLQLASPSGFRYDHIKMERRGSAGSGLLKIMFTMFVDQTTRVQLCSIAFPSPDTMVIEQFHTFPLPQAILNRNVEYLSKKENPTTAGGFGSGLTDACNAILAADGSINFDMYDTYKNEVHWSFFAKNQQTGLAAIGVQKLLAYRLNVYPQPPCLNADHNNLLRITVKLSGIETSFLNEVVPKVSIFWEAPTEFGISRCSVAEPTVTRFGSIFVQRSKGRDFYASIGVPGDDEMYAMVAAPLRDLYVGFVPSPTAGLYVKGLFVQEHTAFCNTILMLGATCEGSQYDVVGRDRNMLTCVDDAVMEILLAASAESDPLVSMMVEEMKGIYSGKAIKLLKNNNDYGKFSPFLAKLFSFGLMGLSGLYKEFVALLGNQNTSFFLPSADPMTKFVIDKLGTHRARILPADPSLYSSEICKITTLEQGMNCLISDLWSHEKLLITPNNEVVMMTRILLNKLSGDTLATQEDSVRSIVVDEAEEMLLSDIKLVRSPPGAVDSKGDRFFVLIMKSDMAVNRNLFRQLLVEIVSGQSCWYPYTPIEGALSLERMWKRDFVMNVHLVLESCHCFPTVLTKDRFNAFVTSALQSQVQEKDDDDETEEPGSIVCNNDHGQGREAEEGDKQGNEIFDEGMAIICASFISNTECLTQKRVSANDFGEGMRRHVRQRTVTN